MTRRKLSSKSKSSKRSRTRTPKRTDQKGKTVEHHHLLARIETALCPDEKDTHKMEIMLETLAKDIGMERLGDAQIFYVNSKEKDKVGMSGILPIQTSHISFHFWKYPIRHTLHNDKSNCLVQFDLYTCGNLNKSKIKTVLELFEQFDPQHANVTLINRRYGMKIDSLTEWDATSRKWKDFVANYN